MRDMDRGAAMRDACTTWNGGEGKTRGTFDR